VFTHGIGRGIGGRHRAPASTIALQVLARAKWCRYPRAAFGEARFACARIKSSRFCSNLADI